MAISDPQVPIADDLPMQAPGGDGPEPPWCAPSCFDLLLDVTDTVDSLREALRGYVLLANLVMQPGAQVEAPQGLEFGALLRLMNDGLQTRLDAAVGALTVARSAADSPQLPAS